MRGGWSLGSLPGLSLGIINSLLKKMFILWHLGSCQNKWGIRCGICWFVFANHWKYTWILSSADNLCKQFGPGLEKSLNHSRSELRPKKMYIQTQYQQPSPPTTPIVVHSYSLHLESDNVILWPRLGVVFRTRCNRSPMLIKWLCVYIRYISKLCLCIIEPVNYIH